MKTFKKMISKLALLGMALMCALSLGTTAYAADGQLSGQSKGTLTVNNVPEGTTVNAYQVITVNVDNASATPEYPMYTWNAKVAEWLKSHKYTAYVGDNNVVTEAFSKIDAETSKKFWSELSADIESLKVENKLTSNTVTGNKVVFNDVAMGEYLVSAVNPNWTFLPTTAVVVPEHNGNAWVVKNGECALKGSSIGGGGETDPDTSTKPSIAKAVDHKTFAIGDTLTYTLNVTAPLYAENAKTKTFKIDDILPTGFQFNNNVVVKVGNKFAEATTVVGTDNYAVTTSGKDFAITFNDKFYQNFAKVDNNGHATNNKLVITYSAKVTSVAASYDDAADDNKASKTNTAKLSFNPDQYGTAEPTVLTSTAVSYTFAASIKKVDSKNKLITTDAAEFTLTRDGKAVKVFKEGNAYYVAGDDKADATNKLTTVNGVLDIKGLGEGKYVLTETKAPNGYVLSQGTVEFTVTNSKVDGILENPSVKNTGKTEIIDAKGENNTVKFSVKNFKMNELEGSKLPATGGMGTMIFTIGGLCIMAAAVGLGVYLNKKKNA